MWRQAPSRWLKQLCGPPSEEPAAASRGSAVLNNPVSLLCCVDFLVEVCSPLPWATKGWSGLHPELGVSPISAFLRDPQHQAGSLGVMLVLWEQPCEIDHVSLLSAPDLHSLMP